MSSTADGTQRDLWKKEVGKGLIVLANLIAGGLIFGQFLNERIDWRSLFIGLFGALGFYSSGALFIKKSNYD